MELKRNIYNDFQEYMKIFPATGIIGPRQVGKTTFAKQMAKGNNNLYLDLETTADREKLSDPLFFLSQFTDRCVILDEIQFMPEMFAALRGIIDADRRPGRFILLGSASPDIMRNSADTLAGRIGYLELTPFTLAEVDDMQTLWLRGGFPLSYLAATDRASALWRRNFIATYIQRDLGLLGLQTDVQIMDRFWRMLASMQGNLLNATDLGRSLDISRPTVMRYIDFLEGAFMLRVLRPWFSNINKRLVKSPKIYIRDTGLLHSLLGLATTEALLNHIQLGASWEGFVIEQIAGNLKEDVQVYFYRTQQGAECDLLLEKNGQVVAAIEIKHGHHPAVGKGFRISMEDTRAKHGYIIGNGADTFKADEGVTITNLPYFLTTILPEL
ncbi:ATPase [Terrimonas sp.]|uniref:ATP-binding protein n=1 Tax=Terrimonas sp. TaxID=1914338 RepID=UPI000D50BB63|nr:ATP-binding protein [Terrimonas sp.]PVD52305.1 ATPase [Terrimonas sp.]